jgi:hypothetical protein
VQSAKKKRSSVSAKSRKGKTRSTAKARSKDKRTATERSTASYPDLPQEELPEPETELNEQFR